jgi:hypothetical protein
MSGSPQDPAFAGISLYQWDQWLAECRDKFGRAPRAFDRVTQRMLLVNHSASSLSQSALTQFEISVPDTFSTRSDMIAPVEDPRRDSLLPETSRRAEARHSGPKDCHARHAYCPSSPFEFLLPEADRKSGFLHS